MCPSSYDAAVRSFLSLSGECLARLDTDPFFELYSDSAWDELECDVELSVSFVSTHAVAPFAPQILLATPSVSSKDHSKAQPSRISQTLR